MSLCLSVPLSLSVSVYLSVSLSVYLGLCVFLSLSVSPSFCLSLYVSLFICQFLFLFVCFSQSLSLSLSVSVTLSASMSISFSVCLYLSLSISLCLSILRSLFICLCVRFVYWQFYIGSILSVKVVIIRLPHLPNQTYTEMDYKGPMVRNPNNKLKPFFIVVFANGTPSSSGKQGVKTFKCVSDSLFICVSVCMLVSHKSNPALRRRGYISKSRCGKELHSRPYT